MLTTVAFALAIAAAPVILILATLAIIGSLVAGPAGATADGWLFRRRS